MKKICSNLFAVLCLMMGTNDVFFVLKRVRIHPMKRVILRH